ncbi:hypothetical protein ES703_00805 [subsurface metagenome]
MHRVFRHKHLELNDTIVDSMVEIIIKRATDKLIKSNCKVYSWKKRGTVP